MDLNLLTIANRASLGTDIKTSITGAKNRITQVKAIVNKIQSSGAFSSDEIEQENPKYTLLLVYILDFWAKMCEIGDYPKDLEPIGESVAKIKYYFKVK